MNPFTGVTLTGTIVKHIAGDHYEFKDKTGSIVIDVDDDLANGWQWSCSWRLLRNTPDVSSAPSSRPGR
ncbi:NirD/YgiW/YdeI family stress tolerance protein, partial [Klebsiella pneumoniae]